MVECNIIVVVKS